MKETIYTIPVNEALDSSIANGGCPFCIMKHRLEEERVRYTLGASMMEPDARELTNMYGFCDEHFKMLFAQPNKLSLALVLDTHLENVRSRLEMSAPTAAKKSGFLKKKSSDTSALNAAISSVVSGCAVCQSVNATTERYIDVFFHMWSTDSTFAEKFDSCSGVCMEHYRELIQKSEKYLSTAKQEHFAGVLYEKQKQLLDALQEDIHKFTLKFDYRNKDMPWGSAKDAPKRVIEYLSGAKLDTDNENQ